MAGIVLCGGKSARMGQPKDELLLRGERLLIRLVRLLGQVTHPVIVVAGSQTRLGDIDTEVDVEIARDELPYRGPLLALARGLELVPSPISIAFVASCDIPLLRPAFVKRLGELVGEADAAVVRHDQITEPLAAVYHKRVATMARLLANDPTKGPKHLLAELNVRLITPNELADVDPDLESVQGFNTPEEWEALRERAGTGLTKTS